jgi:predicted phage-related endonuclease
MVETVSNSSQGKNFAGRQGFIGGSDARIIMGDDEIALVRLWREKRGEIPPEDLSDNLIVQLGSVTENLNRCWYERNTGHAIRDVQRRLWHPVHKWMAATNRTLGGRVRSQIHAALDVFGGSCSRKAHGAAPAQYVGRELPVRGAVNHHRRR